MTDKIIDTERCEGLYVSFTQPNDGQHTPLLIERVNGDCTVTKFIIARDEARKLIDQLREMLPEGRP